MRIHPDPKPTRQTDNTDKQHFGFPIQLFTVRQSLGPMNRVIFFHQTIIYTMNFCPSSFIYATLAGHKAHSRFGEDLFRSPWGNFWLGGRCQWFIALPLEFRPTDSPPWFATVVNSPLAHYTMVQQDLGWGDSGGKRWLAQWCLLVVWLHELANAD